MRNVKKFSLSILVMFVFTMMLTLSAGASWSNVRIAEKGGYTAITVSWDKPTNTDSGYRVTGYQLENESGATVNITDPNRTSYTIKNLPAGYVNTIDVYATYTYTSGSYSSSGTKYLGYTRVNTCPAKVTKLQIDAYGATYEIGTATPTNASGVQVQAVDYRTRKTVAVKKCYSYTTLDLNKNVPYAIRARAYYQNPTSGNIYYGAWTSYQSCLSPWVYGKATNTSSGFTLTVKAASRVLYYNVYISKSLSSGYVKTAKVTPTGSVGTNKTVRITKIGSSAMTSGTKYYVRVVPVLNIGGKATTSKTYFTGSIYVYKR